MTEQDQKIYAIAEKIKEIDGKVNSISAILMFMLGYFYEHDSLFRFLVDKKRGEK